MVKLLKIKDVFGAERYFTANQLINAAANDLECAHGGFMAHLKSLDKVADFDEIADLCAPSCGGWWREAQVVQK